MLGDLRVYKVNKLINIIKIIYMRKRRDLGKVLSYKMKKRIINQIQNLKTKDLDKE